MKESIIIFMAISLMVISLVNGYLSSTIDLSDKKNAEGFALLVGNSLVTLILFVIACIYIKS